MKTFICNKLSKSIWSALITSAIGVSATPTFAQEQVAASDVGNKGAAGTVEKIQVTGSYIRRSEQMESPSPLAVVSAEDMAATGAKSIADVTQTLTINTGAQNNPDGFTQNFTTGTTNINLRGLGLASTLVLMNNKRQVTTAVTAQDGVSFVDTSSMLPMIAIERVEVVKDGASALYGSDAVAGVVNFITRKDFDGALVSFDYQDGAKGGYDEYTAQGLWGTTSNIGSAMLAVSFTDRQPLTTSEYRLGRPGLDAVSSLGNPGSYFIGATPFIDPTGCEEFGGIRNVLAAGVGPGGADAGFCKFDFGGYANLVPDENKFNSYAQASYDLTEELTWTTEFSYARNRAQRIGSPSFPNLKFPTVPANHPDNVFGMPVAFFGRAIGNGAPIDTSPANIESDTARFSTSLEGETDSGYWQLSFTRATNDYQIVSLDTLTNEFQDALNGFGGPSCNVSTGTAGEGVCSYYNPFATAYTTSPNDPAVVANLFGEMVIDAKSDLTVVEAFFSTELFEFGVDSAYLAAGIQYRKQSLEQDYNHNANTDQFVFTIGNPDLSGSADVYAAFAELALPFTDDLDVQIAARYEDHGSVIGSTFDPKFAAVYRVTDTLNFRGSFSTSFRTPSVFQQQGGQTSLGSVIDPVSKSQAFVALRSSGNPELAPEESKAFNLGLSMEPIEALTIDLDYWSFDFEDVIIETNAQAIVNASVNSPNPSSVIRAGDPLTGPVVQVNTSFINASSVKTTGIDFNINYHIETSVGDFMPSLSGTYITSYDLNDPQAGDIDGAGRRNYSNFGTSTPELRYNLGLAWQGESVSANLFARYTKGYVDDENCSDDSKSLSGVCANGYRAVDSHMTIDAQVNFDLGNVLDLNNDYALSIGGTNLTNEAPPIVFTDVGFDSKVHDPRGRLVYAKFMAAF